MELRSLIPGHTTAITDLRLQYPVTKVSLTLPKEMEFDEWVDLGKKLLLATRSCMWWLGDWWAYGQHKYGERAAAVELWGDDSYTFQALADAGYVARAYEISRRREVLSFSHHREAAAIKDTDERDRLLRAAIDENWSTRQLRKAVRDHKAALDKKKPDPLPQGKYTIIYADPPWKYNDERNLDGYDTNAASNSYPTMSLAELIALPVKKLAAKDCVIFLWAPAPLLPDCLILLHEWGFVYKTNIIWDKVVPGMGGLGHYHNTNHELLLIGTRGSYIKVEAKYDSVQVHKKSKRHSEKPEVFREIIDIMYPQTEEIDRIELFRRGDIPTGWRVWGNEAAIEI